MNTATGRAGAPGGMSAVCDAQATSMDALTQAYALWIGNAARIHAEFLRFLSERFQKDAQTLAEFAACRNPAEVMQLQFELASSIPADYFVESQKLLALLDRAATQNGQQVT